MLQRINLFCTFVDKQDQDIQIEDGLSQSIDNSAQKQNEYLEGPDSPSE